MNASYVLRHTIHFLLSAHAVNSTVDCDST
jgi:hypothetical protein